MTAEQDRRSARRSPPDLPVIGWREWVALPEMGVDRIKAKVDTGARTSSLHAFDLERFEREGRPMVRFEAHPLQRDASERIPVEAELVDRRSVRTSGGESTMRPVVATEVNLMDRRWTIELTLIRRDPMGFRMLLGRQAIKGRFLVDPLEIGDRSIAPGERARLELPVVSLPTGTRVSLPVEVVHGASPGPRPTGCVAPRRHEELSDAVSRRVVARPSSSFRMPVTTLSGTS